MIRIAVSACLLGKNVRYDGGNKNIELSKHFNSETYQLCGICPEVEMGMSIPRKPIQILKSQNQINLVQVDNPNINHTHGMIQWFKNNLNHLSQYQGFILKSKSPSCGNQTTVHFSSNKNQNLSDGYFVYLLKEHFNNPLIIDEIGLNNPIFLSKFKKSLLLSLI